MKIKFGKREICKLEKMLAECQKGCSARIFTIMNIVQRLNTAIQSIPACDRKSLNGTIISLHHGSEIAGSYKGTPYSTTVDMEINSSGIKVLKAVRAVTKRTDYKITLSNEAKLSILENIEKSKNKHFDYPKPTIEAYV